jgi:cytochrome c-type biogenesis protein CcmF
VVDVYKDGAQIAQLYPRRDFYYESQQAMTIPGLRSNFENDVYVLLVEWEPLTAQRATFKLYVNPLVNWVWWGGFVFIAGTLIAAWPEAELAYVPARRPARNLNPERP